MTYSEDPESNLSKNLPLNSSLAQTPTFSLENPPNSMSTASEPVQLNIYQSQLMADVGQPYIDSAPFAPEQQQPYEVNPSHTLPRIQVSVPAQSHQTQLQTSPHTQDPNPGYGSYEQQGTYQMYMTASAPPFTYSTQKVQGFTAETTYPSTSLKNHVSQDHIPNLDTYPTIPLKPSIVSPLEHSLQASSQIAENAVPFQSYPQMISQPNIYGPSQANQSDGKSINISNTRVDSYNYLNPTFPPINSYSSITSTFDNSLVEDNLSHRSVEPENFLNSHQPFSQLSGPKIGPVSERADSVASISTTSTSSLSSGDDKSTTQRKRRGKGTTTYNMTPETAKRNRCKICNKQFKRPSSLQTHYHMHTGEKNCKCTWENCGKMFSVRSNMIRHYRLHERDLERARAGSKE